MAVCLMTWRVVGMACFEGWIQVVWGNVLVMVL